MSPIAPILEQTVSKIRFCVDDVRHNQERLPVHNAKSQLEQCFKQRLLAFSHDDTFQVIQDQGIHPLPLAVHAAFSDHRRLLLTPDIIWIAITQGFAQHINNHAEALRSHFVRHQGKQQLVVECEGIPNQSQHWVEAVHHWVLHIRDHVGADLYQLLECNFSTTTPITHTASHVVMMDAFQQYFDYEILCVCGIPEITLLGTVEDWQSIYERIQRMAQYDLNWWTDRFAQLLDQIQQQHQTRPPINWSTFDSGFLDVPKEHIQLLTRFDGATLYANSGHSWQIAKYDSGKVYTILQLNSCSSATHLIDLEDGRCIAYIHNFRPSEWWIILGKPASYADPYDPERLQFQLEDVVIIAKGIPQLLERIFQTEGCYYFDDPSFVPDDV